MTNAEDIKRRRAEAKLRGDCSTCMSRPAKLGRLTCQSCLDATKAAKVELRAESRCDRCRRATGGTVRCSPCSAAMHRRYTDRKKAAGKCVRPGCHWPSVPGLVHCMLCRERNRQAVRAWNRRNGPVEPRHCTLCRSPEHNRMSCLLAVAA